jgi:hypothetical protein
VHLNAKKPTHCRFANKIVRIGLSKSDLPELSKIVLDTNFNNKSWQLPANNKLNIFGLIMLLFILPNALMPISNNVYLKYLQIFNIAQKNPNKVTTQDKCNDLFHGIYEKKHGTCKIYGQELHFSNDSKIFIPLADNPAKTTCRIITCNPECQLPEDINTKLCAIGNNLQ